MVSESGFRLELITFGELVRLKACGQPEPKHKQTEALRRESADDESLL